MVKHRALGDRLQASWALKGHSLTAFVPPAVLESFVLICFPKLPTLLEGMYRRLNMFSVQLRMQMTLLPSMLHSEVLGNISRSNKMIKDPCLDNDCRLTTCSPVSTFDV